VGEESQKRDRHRPLFELATRQHGVISTRQLDDLGYSPSSAAKAATVGRLRRIHRGVYAVGHEDLSWHGRCMAAVLAARPSVASHFSAGWLWGLLRSRPGTIHVTTPTPRRSSRDFVVHCADLPSQDRRVPEGIPATALPRTMLDLAARVSPVGLERVIERAEELRAFDLLAINELLGRTAGHAGNGALRRALDIYRPEPAFRRSTLETLFLELVREAGLPDPAMNYVVGGFELDAYWEAERFAVELDVYATHGSRAAFERDRLRQEDLLLLGIGTTRVTGPRLRREPERVMERIELLLDQRRGRFSPSI
jgi:predicted transcriptional regulator of viral defense system/very-short-patch-repair endonuclease